MTTLTYALYKSFIHTRVFVLYFGTENVKIQPQYTNTQQDTANTTLYYHMHKTALTLYTALTVWTALLKSMIITHFIWQAPPDTNANPER
jgi:hypothetical protein